MIDRVGQVWEFSDGMIILVVCSRAKSSEQGAFEHDAMVLVNGFDAYEEYKSGAFTPSWREKRSWDSDLLERWRIA